MISKTLLELEPHAVHLTRQVDQVCDRFEAAWKLAVTAGGRPPRMEEYLFGTSEPQFSALRRELEELAAAYQPLHRSARSGRPASHGGGKTATPSSTDAPLSSAHFALASTLDLAAVQNAPASDPATGSRINGSTLTPEKGIRCIHCHHPLDLTESGREEVHCPACGSSFRICDAERAGVLPLNGGVRRPVKAGIPIHRLAPSQLLANFELIERVGVGAYGEVWRAADTKLHRTVALKIPLPVFASEPSLLERFHREARTAAQLRHPGIVSVHEVIMVDGIPVIVSDFIHGVSLRKLLADRRLTFEEAAELAAKVADALDYAHSMEVVHRDIKPGNIMVSDDRRMMSESEKDSSKGSSSHMTHHSLLAPLIMDFGLALREDAEITLTMDGHVVGTPAYMSPEQAVGQGHTADRRSDVYSLGVILYEMLAGELPFRGSKKYILEQVDRDEPRPPRKINDKIPRDLETIVLKAMNKIPSRRYPTARELADDLRRFLRHEPIRARPVGRTEKLLRWCRRNPALATAASIGFVAIIGASISLAVAAVSAQAANEIRAEKGKTDKAKADVDKALEVARNNHKQTQKVSRQLMLHRAQMLGEQGEIGQAMLWLARGLTDDPNADQDLQRVIRLNLSAFYSQLNPLQEILPHPAEVLALAFSRDGKILATGCADKKVRIWDPATGKLLREISGHQGTIVALAFSPKGHKVLAGSGDEAVLWDAATGKRVSSFSQKNVQAGIFSPDGGSVLTSGYTESRTKKSEDKKTVQLWNVLTGKPVGDPLVHKTQVRALAFSPDGKMMVTASGTVTQLWDLPAGTRHGDPFLQPGVVESVSFSPDGRTILTGSQDGTTRLWEVATGRQTTPTLPNQGPLLTVAFSTDGQTILTGGGNKTATLWTSDTGTLVGQPLPHQAAVQAAAFSPDGMIVATASADRTVKLWRIAPRMPQLRVLKHSGPVRAAAYSLDGKYIATGTSTVNAANGFENGFEGAARVWEVATGTPKGPPLSHEGWVLTVAFSPDAKTLLTGSSDKTARLWDVATGKELHRFPHQGWVWSATFSHDGKTVATTAGSQRDRTVRLWDAANGKLKVEPLVHPNGVSSVAFSPDGKTLVTGCNDNSAYIWSVATGKLLHRLTGHQGTVWTAAYAPNGQTIATASADHTARLWDPGNGQPVGAVLTHQGEVRSLSFSPDGRKLLTGSLDNTARLWDTTTGEAAGPALQHRAGVFSVAFSIHGRSVLTASNDHTCQLWDVATGEANGPRCRHEASASVVAVSPDGSTFLTCSDDATARVWSMPVPLPGQVVRVRLWSQLVSGIELDRDDGLQVLDGQAWQDYRRKLQESGGAP